MRLARPLAALGAALAALILAAGPAHARGVPPGFVGMNADGPLLDGRVNLPSELRAMRASGVETVRFALNWSLAQPLPPGSARPAGWADVNGVPTHWAPVDRIMAALGVQHLRILPVILQSPVWARLRPPQEWSPPTPPARTRYAAFCAALVRRYGPTGSFWVSRPRTQRSPVVDWQIWNEPNGTLFWAQKHGIPDYVRLLVPAARAIHVADRRARVVLGGLVGLSWHALDEVYRRGGGSSFDVAAIHPFTRKLDDVVLLVQRARQVMARHHDARKSLDLTEISWTSGARTLRRTFGYDETEAGQARRVAAAFTRLAADRARYRLGLVSWYTWLSADRDRSYPFDFSGLRTLRDGKVRDKPAFAAFSAVARRLRR